MTLVSSRNFCSEDFLRLAPPPPPPPRADDADFGLPLPVADVACVDLSASSMSMGKGRDLPLRRVEARVCRSSTSSTSSLVGNCDNEFAWLPFVFALLLIGISLAVHTLVSLDISRADNESFCLLARVDLLVVIFTIVGLSSCTIAVQG